MESKIKSAYDINCKWYADTQDAAGNSKNSWNGEILVLGDNSCFGYATDEGHKEPTHLLVGVIVDGSGLSICKIHREKDEYDPIIFDAFANANGAENVYYGDFLAKTFFNYVPMGIASVETKEKTLERADIERITSLYSLASETIKSKPSISALTLKEYDEMDFADMSTKLQIVANDIYKNELPEIFLNKEESQPGSGVN
ncbi:MAG: hypothetical protein IKD36_00095 [Clostridia bacterium]|nr:hypothetical protein [Clostridia bacterium]